MLKIEDIQKIAEDNGIEVLARYPQYCEGFTPPKPISLTLYFREEKVDAWQVLMSDLTEVPVSINGTRISSPSGAIDGSLYPAYASRLSIVNAARATVGLDRAY
ncbi:hypothetical protein LC612_30550 [Nostoc sp. CHAB 5834]|nr:hypothetical protein [Nostoc sp. CHAB 5834]